MHTGLCWNARRDSHINPVDRSIVSVSFHLMYSSTMPGGLRVHLILSNILLLIFLFPISFVLVEPVGKTLGILDTIVMTAIIKLLVTCGAGGTALKQRQFDVEPGQRSREPNPGAGQVQAEGMEPRTEKQGCWQAVGTKSIFERQVSGTPSRPVDTNCRGIQQTTPGRMPARVNCRVDSPETGALCYLSHIWKF